MNDKEPLKRIEVKLPLSLYLRVKSEIGNKISRVIRKQIIDLLSKSSGIDPRLLICPLCKKQFSSPCEMFYHESLIWDNKRSTNILCKKCAKDIYPKEEPPMDISMLNEEQIKVNNDYDVLNKENHLLNDNHSEALALFYTKMLKEYSYMWDFDDELHNLICDDVLNSPKFDIPQKS